MSDKLHGGIKAARTSVSLPVEFRKTSDSTELTGKVYTDVTAYYVRQGGSPTAITMATLSGPSASYSSGGFCEVDGTNMKGLYRFDPPNACFATGADWVAFSLTISGAFVASFMFALETKGAADLNDIAATSIVSSGAITTSGGAVSTVTTVGTLTTYAGNTPQTGDTFGRIGVAGAGLTALGDTRLANLDTNVGSRMATFTYTAPLSALGVRSAIGMASADLDTQLSGILSAASAPGSTPPTTGDITTAVWAANPATFTSGSIGYTLNNRITSIKTKTDLLSTTPAGDVWEILTADHSTAGTFGAAMAAAGTAGDPWTTPLPGAYGPGTAGYIVGHFSSGVTVDLSAVLAAQATAQVALAKIQAAVYDSARTVGHTIVLSNGHTQTITHSGRVTA